LGRIGFGSKLKIIATGAALWMTTVAKTVAESPHPDVCKSKIIQNHIKNGFAHQE